MVDTSDSILRTICYFVPGQFWLSLTNWKKAEAVVFVRNKPWLIDLIA